MKLLLFTFTATKRDANYSMLITLVSIHNFVQLKIKQVHNGKRGSSHSVWTKGSGT